MGEHKKILIYRIHSDKWEIKEIASYPIYVNLNW